MSGNGRGLGLLDRELDLQHPFLDATNRIVDRIDRIADFFDRIVSGLHIAADGGDLAENFGRDLVEGIVESVRCGGHASVEVPETILLGLAHRLDRGELEPAEQFGIRFDGTPKVVPAGPPE